MMSSRRPNGYWNFFNTLCELVSVMRRKNLTTIPSAKALKEKGISHLVYPIKKNGGFRTFREALGQDQLRAEFQDYRDDPLAYYHKNHTGLTPKQLENENQGLYQKLKTEGLLNHLPRKYAKPQDYGDDPLAYYNTHHEGLTRGQLEKENTGLYQKLRREGLLNHLPRKKAKPQDYGDDSFAFYQKKYAGLTRGQLAKENHGLYEKLRIEGLLYQIPKKNYAPSKELLEEMIDDYIGDDDDG